MSFDRRRHYHLCLRVARSRFASPAARHTGDGAPTLSSVSRPLVILVSEMAPALLCECMVVDIELVESRCVVRVEGQSGDCTRYLCAPRLSPPNAATHCSMRGIARISTIRLTLSRTRAMPNDAHSRTRPRSLAIASRYLRHPRPREESERGLQRIVSMLQKFDHLNLSENEIKILKKSKFMSIFFKIQNYFKISVRFN